MTWDLAASTRRGAAALSAGHQLAADAGPPARDIGGLLLIGLVVVLAYLGSCRIWPYGPCFACRLNPRRNPGSNR
jgi:hypothetical protein